MLQLCRGFSFFAFLLVKIDKSANQNLKCDKFADQNQLVPIMKIWVKFAYFPI